MKGLRNFTLALCMTIIVSMLFGCAAKSPAETSSGEITGVNESTNAVQSTDAAEPVKLYFWSAIPEANGPKQAMEAYTALHPNVEFEFVQLAWDDASDTKLVTALMSNDGADVYMPTRNYVGKAENGVALDLTEYLARDGIDLARDVGADVATYQYNGKYYSIPTTRSMVFWILNMDKFEKAGIPIPDVNWTIDEFMEIAKKLSTGSGADKTYGAYITSNWSNMWNCIGAGYADNKDFYADGLKQSRYTDPVITEMLNRFLQMTNVDKSLPTYSECIAEKYAPNQMLLTEKAAMVYSGSYVLRDVKNKEAYPHTFKIAFALPPLDPKYDKQVRVASLEDPIMINSNSKYLDEAWKFTKWFYQEGISSFISGGRVPSYTSFSKDQVADLFTGGYEDLIDKESFKKIYESSRAYATLYQGLDEAVTALDQETQKAMVGSISAEDALKAAKDRADKYLASRK